MKKDIIYEVYIVMHSTRKWKEGTSSLYGDYAIEPKVLSVYDTYDGAKAYIERHKDYQPCANGWSTRDHRLPGTTDMLCFSRMWIIEKPLWKKESA